MLTWAFSKTGGNIILELQISRSWVS